MLEGRKEVIHSQTKSGEREFGRSIFVKQKKLKEKEKTMKKAGLLLDWKGGDIPKSGVKKG